MAAWPQTVPIPQWTQITMGATRSHSWYNSLQLKFEKQMSRGLYTLASYTYASAIDEAGAYDAGTQPQYLDNLAAERGPQSQTARHRFTWTNVYALPVGRGRKFGGELESRDRRVPRRLADLQHRQHSHRPARSTSRCPRPASTRPPTATTRSSAAMAAGCGRTAWARRTAASIPRPTACISST